MVRKTSSRNVRPRIRTLSTREKFYPMEIRHIYPQNLDVQGNLSKKIAVSEVEKLARYITFGGIFTEVKVMSMKVDLVPGPIIRNPSLSMGSILRVAQHADLTGITCDDELVVNPLTRVSPVTHDAIVSCTWKLNTNDAAENQFYNAKGNTLISHLPATLGGVMIFSDGPVAYANGYFGDLVVTWQLLYRGMYIN